MPIKIKTGAKKKAVSKTAVEDSAFSRWYKTHGKSLNDERRVRYHNDPEYRKGILDKARASRENRRKKLVKPEQYRHSLADVSEGLDVTVWTLRNWRANEYFPEPYKFNGELWFTSKQLALLVQIREFLKDIPRMTAQQREELAKIVARVKGNW